VAKKKWLMLGLLILVMAIAVPMTLFAESPEVKIEVQAEHPSGAKLHGQVTVPSSGLGDAEDCLAGSGQLQYEVGGVQTEIQGPLWIKFLDDEGRIEIHDEATCAFLEVEPTEVRIVLGTPAVAAESGLTGDGSDPFSLPAGDKVEIKLELK